MSPRLVRIAVDIAASALALAAMERAASADAVTQPPLNVLFVGNSFTHGNIEPTYSFNGAAITDANNTNQGGVPGIFKKMADQVGLSFQVTIEAVSGQTLQFHCQNKLSIIGQSKWNDVVLQEFSTGPLPPERGGNPDGFYSALSTLKNLIQANSGASIYLYETWARPNLVFPQGSPYDGLGLSAMQTELNRSYYNANNIDHLAGVGPVGDAFLRAIREGIANPDPYNPTPTGMLNLWDVDDYHASKYGSYLSAAVWLARLTGADPRNLPIGPGSAADGMSINPVDATRLNALAYESTHVPATSWTADGDGNWNSAGNWSDGVPNIADATANFGAAITSPRTVTLDSTATAGTVYFSSGHSYTLTGSSPLTLETSAGQVGISVVNGSHMMSAPLELRNDLAINAAPGSGVAITNLAPAPGKQIIKLGAGTAQFNNVRASSLIVSAGSVSISAKSKSNAPDGTSVLVGLDISPGAKLNLTNNSMVIDYTGASAPLLSQLRAELQSGRLISSNSVAPFLTRIGYADNMLLNQSTFGGIGVDASSILMKRVIAGDANLDGTVDVTDLGALATNWQQPGAVWTDGDFNYDGVVDVTDLGILATDWQDASTSGIASLVSRLSEIRAPEPTHLIPAAALFTVAHCRSIRPTLRRAKR